jgi:uncharacterized phage protein (TIGR02218 family)
VKVLSAELLAHYAGDLHTLARLWKITRRDLTVFAFTDHDAAIEYPPADSDSLTYEPSSVFDASAIETRGELNVDNLEVQGLLDSVGITAQDLEAGLWDGSTVEIVEVNYKDLTMGHNPLRYGTLGEVQRNSLTYTAELRGLMHALQNNIGRTVKPSCDAVLGDARCGVDIEALRVSGAVTVATSNRVFTTDVNGSDTYTYGVLTWTTGLNAGLSMEVKLHATAVLTLQIEMPYTVQVGDDFTVTPGCDKTKPTCIATFDNVINFRGFSFVPGQDKVLKVGGQ